ncbi:hypothetical protein I4F81_010966 [Pyropia yezoensis]|uniref:Uncharacterized protein n=1 Tax=Pyropia yezoensis TaxID=2788 RepID=A0ACC3CEG3_PYRYE|nr:hypothetical protein I4F81_010966 [Neopyropia yezoensis]
MRPRAVALSAAAVLLAVASSAVRTCRPASVVAVLSAVGWPLAACPLVAPLASPADNRRAVLPSHDAVAALARPLVESPPDGSEPLVQTLSVAVVTTAGGTRTYHFGVVGGRTGGGATASAPDGGSSASGGGSEGASAATESAAPPTDATVYELGSITKAFTGLLVSDLVARSPHVRLDTPVNALLPPGVGLPGRRGGAVTLRHLLTHTSGLPREAPAMPLADGAAAEAATDNAVAPTNYSVDHLYALLGRETLPRLGLTARACGGGAPRVYSNYAVGLGGHAVGRAVGAPSYAAALDAAVLRPLGLAATTIGGPSAATDPAPATAAAPADVDGRPAPEHRMTDARAAAGGLRSSVADLTSWAAFCLDACRGGDGWFRVPPPGTTGFRGGSTPFRRPPTAWYSAGGTPGFTTALYVDPTIGLAVLAAGNVGGSGAVFDLAVDRGQAAMASSAVAPPSQPLSDAPPVDPVQYVVVRADLAAPPHGWPAGALMAQAVHAALAAAVAYADHPVTAAYTAQRGGAHLPGSLAPPSPPPSPPSSATSLAGGDPDAADTAAAPQMHTVVLAAKGEAALEGLAAKLEAAALDFVLWREQPEGVATALATRPYPRAEVRQHFRKLRLFSAPASPAAAAAAAPRPNGGG